MANPIDTLAAKVKAAQKGMEARREGLVGVFHTLAKQHGEASALIERLKNDASKRDALWPKIKLALLAHERGELEAVYPVLADYSALEAFVAQHAREASDLEAMILRLDDRSIVGDAWGSSIVELGDAVFSHAFEEENAIFPAALAAIGEDRAGELDDAFRAAHKKLEASLKRTTH